MVAELNTYDKTSCSISNFQYMRVTVGYRASVTHFSLRLNSQASLGDCWIECEAVTSTTATCRPGTATHHLGVVTD